MIDMANFQKVYEATAEIHNVSSLLSGAIANDGLSASEKTQALLHIEAAKNKISAVQPKDIPVMS